MYMQCYCDNKHEPNKEAPYVGACAETIAYMNHHDWGREEDYMCEKCLENCLDNDDNKKQKDSK